MNYQTQAACVFPSPSKIPYGGFSPVRLQTGIQPRPSHRLQVVKRPAYPQRRLYAGKSLGTRCDLRPTKGTVKGH